MTLDDGVGLVEGEVEDGGEEGVRRKGWVPRVDPEAKQEWRREKKGEEGAGEGRGEEKREEERK